MPSALPDFDELFVVSDLHMGGARHGDVDFQIFNRGARLGAFIDHLRTLRADKRLALVLNGDVVDSLAEEEVPGYVALDAHTAVTMLERICADPAFAPVWNALASFVRTARRYLVVVVGNHDIELALPPVEAFIRQRLAGNSDAAQSRITFATHGGGYACRVGGARVFCTHGNEVDAWNTVDQSKLGELANAMNAGRGVEASKWKPNAGTRLVIDVMNGFKRRFPFVDLLKPETGPVVGTLLTLDEKALQHVDLSDVYPILRDKSHGAEMVEGLLSADAAQAAGVPSARVADDVAASVLGAHLGEAVRTAKDGANAPMQSEDALLRKAEERFLDGVEPAAVTEDAGVEGTLGWSDVFAGWIGLVDKEDALRRALLDWIKDDDTYLTATRDDTFERITARVGAEVDFVVTGHTHLARAIAFGPKRYYFNCGTWIRLLRLTTQALHDESAFEPVYRALASGSMDALDTAKIPGPQGTQDLVFDRTNAVRISAEGGRTVGSLLRVQDKDGGGVDLPLEDGTTAFEV